MALNFEDAYEALEEGAQEAADTAQAMYDVAVNDGQEALLEGFVDEAAEYAYDSIMEFDYNEGYFLDICLASSDGVIEALSDTVFQCASDCSAIADDAYNNFFEALFDFD